MKDVTGYGLTASGLRATSIMCLKMLEMGKHLVWKIFISFFGPETYHKFLNTYYF